MKIDKLHALELSLTIGCRLDCLYCPQKLLLNKYYEKEKARKSKLEFEDFKIALDKVRRYLFLGCQNRFIMRDALI